MTNPALTYDALRHFADSWGLLFMVLFFAGAIGLALRPGARAAHDEARMIPFREEETEQ